MLRRLSLAGLLILALTTALLLSRPARPAAALAARLTLPAVECAAGGASVRFAWTAVPGSFDQWLDLSAADESFQPGSFVTSGALDAARNSYTWSGITPGRVYYWRVNARMDGGWATSATSAFVPCGGPALLWGPLTCTSPGRASVHFRWAPASNGSLQYLDLSLDPGFAPGTFVAAGPMDAAAQEYAWDGLEAGVPYFFRVNSLGSDGAWRSTSVAGFTADCAGAPEVSADLYGSNDRFVISRLGIDAPVNVRDVGPDGVMGDPLGPWDVVRYDFGGYDGDLAFPGSGGDVLIAGHVDYRPNIMAIFWELRGARPGDVIDYYRGDGVRVQYAVDWVQHFPAAFDVNTLRANSGPETLTLISCGGVFNPATRQYDLRLVVHALLLE